MQLITLAAGNPMFKTESIKTKKENMNNKAKHQGSSVKSGKNFFTALHDFIRAVSLKLRLKDVGHSIECKGKVKLTGTKNIKIGDYCTINKNIHFHTAGRGYIHLGKNVQLGKGVRIVSGSNITIEDNAHIGDHVFIRDTYGYNSENANQKNTKPVYIGKNTWIGKGTRIHAGITIGHDSTITPHSIVARSIPPEVIAGGTPAKVISDRK